MEAELQLLKRYESSFPLVVMLRLALESLVDSEFDRVFEEERNRQYLREILFSDMGKIISEVVLRLSPSPFYAFKQHKETLQVSSAAFYNKLNRIEPATTAAVVANCAQKVREFQSALNFQPWHWLDGYRCRVIDGNHLRASEGRITELRNHWSSGLPGTVVAILDLQSFVIDQVFLIEDGHAQERTVLGEVAKSVQSKDLILGDRQYCTTNFLRDIASQNACFVIRQHGTLKGELLGKRIKIGRGDSGVVYEQSIVIGKTNKDPGQMYRRVTIELDKPTEEGEPEVHILTNVPVADADAIRVAELYRARWQIEQVFYCITQAFRCEVKGLGHPKAALFVFCMAVIAYNAWQVILAALATAHGEDVSEVLSHKSMSQEIASHFNGFLFTVPDAIWRSQKPTSMPQKTKWLKQLALKFSLKKHKKSIRGPKKPPPEKSDYINGAHLSTFKLLKKRNERC
jgi:hypothetical protein